MLPSDGGASDGGASDGGASDGGASDGGGGNPYAGPHELRLRKVITARSETVRSAASAWTDGATKLAAVAKVLKQQADQIELAYEGDTGREASARYLEVRETVLKRQEEMTTAATSLTQSADAIDDAQTAYHGLPGVMSPPGEFTPSGNPITDTVLKGRHAAEQAGHDVSVANRENQARQAMSELDQSFGTSAELMGEVAGEKPPVHDSAGEPSGGRTPITTGTGPSKPRGHGLVGTTDGADDPGTTRPDDTTGTGHVDTDVTPTGSDDDDNVGNVSGGDPIPHPGDPLPPRGGPAGGPTGSPVGGPIGGPGAVGTGAVLGAGAVSGAGAIAASRGTSASVRPVATPGSSGAIGRSASQAARGTLGRSMVPGQMVPGQQGAPGRSGTAGRAGSRGIAPSQQGWGQQGSGQQGSATAGRAGARGTAGGRGAPGSGGSTTGRKGPLSAAATGGRQGKRDEEREGREGMVFDEEQSWLDDDSSGDAVID
jgi:hypothetical protein